MKFIKINFLSFFKEIKQNNKNTTLFCFFSLIHQTALFEFFKKLYFDGYSFIYPDTYSIIHFFENKAYYYYVNFWYPGHYGLLVPIHWHWLELSYLYFSIFFVFLGWLDVYFVPKLKKKYKWYEEYFGIYYTINPKEFFIGSGLEAVLNMEMDRRALHVLMKKSDNPEHRETFFDQFLEVNRQYLERMEEITYDFNYVFFTLYNEYTTFEQDMDFIFVAIFFPFGLLGAVYIYGKPFGLGLLKGQRLLMHVDDLRLVYNGDLSVFSEFFKRASYSFSEIMSNYIFTNVWDAEGLDDDKQYYFNFYWNDLLLEPEPSSLINKIFYQPEVPDYYIETQNPYLIKQQMEFPRYRFLKHNVMSATDKYFVSTNSLLVQPLSSITFHTTTLEAVDKEATYPPFYDQVELQAFGAPEEISVPWLKKSPIYNHMGDFFFELYTIDLLKNNKSIENYLKLAPGHLSPYAFAPKWTHFGHLYTFFNPRSSFFKLAYLENCYQELFLEEDEKNIITQIASDDEVNELFLEIETEVVVPSRFGGEYYDNVTPISVRQDFLDGVSSPNMWDSSSLIKFEGGVPLSSDWSSLVPSDRKLYGLPLTVTMNTLKEQLKVYLFTQTYLDLLQSKYGFLLGKYMFTSIGNSLEFYLFSLTKLSIDWDWYERSHYISFPDLTFDYNMVQDFHDDYFGPVSSKYSLFLDQQVNLFSSGATADWYLAYDFDDSILQLMELHKNVGENVSWPLYYDDEYYYDNAPTFKGFFSNVSDSFTSNNNIFFNRFWKVLNWYLGGDSIKYIIHGLFFNSVNLYLTQKMLYPFYLQLPVLTYSLPETMITNSYWMSSSIMNYPHSTFYPTLFYFQNFLKIPSYGVAMPTAAALFDYNYFEYKDPQETFDGHLVFSELEIYNYFANNINNFFEQKFNSKFSYYVDYWLLYPPFEDFVGNLNFEWCKWHPTIIHFWFEKDLFDQLFSQLVSPVYFEDFFGHINMDAYWGYYYDVYFSYKNFPVLSIPDKVESFVTACHIFGSEFYHPVYTVPQLEDRSYTVQAQEFYFDLFVEQWENYMVNPDFLYDLAERNKLMFEDCDVLYPELGPTWSEVWPHWEEEETIFPFLVFYEPYYNWNFNSIYPFEPQEWVRFIFVEPYLRLVTSDMWTFDEESVTSNIYDEPSRHPDGSQYQDVTFSLQNNQEYKDEDMDSPEFYDVDIYLEEYVIGWYEQEIITEFFSNSIKYDEIDWITRAALWTAGFDCDKNGVFHVNVVHSTFDEDPNYFIPQESISDTPVFWDDEEYDESIFNSYYLPLADKRGVLRYRDHFFVMSNFAAYKVGLDFEDMPWYVDDITDYDEDGDLLDWYMDHDPRYGTVWPQIGMDGDLNSFSPSYFEYAGFWDDSEDLEPYEIDWEDPDDFFLHDPYLETLQESFIHFFPGPAVYFLPEVFPTIAWHGYPIPVDSEGWVAITWFWRIASLDDINYGWQYVGSEYPCVILPSHNSFVSYFADTLGIFNQNFDGENVYQPYSIMLDDTEYPYFFNPKEQGFGLNLDHYFIEHFLPDDTYIFEHLPYSDAVLDDEPWDDEEDDEDIEEEDGEEFTIEDAGVDWDILTVGQEWAGELYGFDEMEYGDDMEEAELDEEIDDYLFEENDYIIDWNLFNKGIIQQSVLPFKNCIDNYTIPWYINTKMFKLNTIDYFQFPEYQPYLLQEHKETLMTKWYFRKFYSKLWTKPNLTPIYDLKDDWDRFLDRWYGYAVYWHTQNSRPWPHYYINQPISDLDEYPSEPVNEIIDFRLLSKVEWYKYFSDYADVQYSHPTKFIWNRYSFLRAESKLPAWNFFDSLINNGTVLKHLSVSGFMEFGTQQKYDYNFDLNSLLNFSVFSEKISFLWKEFKHFFKNESYLKGHQAHIPKSFSLSLNIKEETNFVLNFIANANTEWEQMNKHNYPMDSDTIETLNIDFQLLTDGFLDCFLRYDFSLKRLDGFIYNDYLCMDNTLLPLDFKDPLFFSTVLRFEYWQSSFEHFLFFRFVFFVGSFLNVSDEILGKLAYWFFWNSDDIYFEARLWSLLFDFLCRLRFSTV